MNKVIFLAVVMAGCSQPVNNLSEPSAREIRETDIAMNDLAVKEGFNKALLAYADDHLIKPQDGQMPIVGKKALEDHYAGKDGTTAISWSPFFAEASSSGDLGYTLGNWKYVTPDTTMYGLYYTVWKKQADGKWRWSVDGGNNMPGEFKMSQ